MKKLLVAALSVLLMACSSNGGSEPTPPKDDSNKEFKTYTISLGMGGELSSEEYSPLTKTSGDDLYAIQVYSRPADSGGSYGAYAYGAFDSLDEMYITLDNEHTYYFEANMIPNGKNEKGYYFHLNSGWTSIYENKFIISSDTKFVEMTRGSQYLKGEYKLYDHPSIDRFYGITDDFNPADSDKVTINMKRVAFGLKVVAEELTEGVVYVDLDRCPTRLKIDSAQGNTASDIISFWETGLCYRTGDSFSEDIKVTVTWQKDSGTIIPIVSKNVTFKRNQMTTLTCTIAEPQNESNVSFTNTDEVMTDGDVIALN